MPIISRVAMVTVMYYNEKENTVLSNPPVDRYYYSFQFSANSTILREY